MFRRWMSKDPLFFRIVCFVVLVHGLGLGFLAWNLPHTSSKMSKDKQLVVKTVKLNPPKKVVSEEKVIAEASPPPPPKKKTLPPKKTSSTNKKKEKPKEKPKPPKVDDKKKKLLQKAQEALAKIDQRDEKITAKSTHTKKVPKQIDNLSFVGVKSSEKIESSSQSSYRSELATHLRAQLQLPEMGNVEVKLIVTREGKVESVLIVSSESDLNADYITKTLPSLSLPPFGNTFSSSKTHAFHITLTNE